MTACAYESYWAAANQASGLEDATETLRGGHSGPAIVGNFGGRRHNTGHAVKSFDAEKVMGTRPKRG
jgi:hypothetical protein